MHVFLLLCGVVLFVDVIYSMVYFEYTYYLELKKRFANGKNLPWEYSQQLKWEVKKEVGLFRRLTQATYVPWLLLSCFMNLWYLPVIVTVAIAITNLFYKRAYISPFMLLFNLLIMCCSFGYTVVYLGLFFFK